MTKVAVVIGRFQPFHLGHKAMIDHALSAADRVVVLLGDTGCARDSKDPWSIPERVQMIDAVFLKEIKEGRLAIGGVYDIPYNDAEWTHASMTAVSAVIRHGLGLDPAECEVFQVSHVKSTANASASVLPMRQLAAPVTYVADNAHGLTVMNATEIREEIIFGGHALARTSVSAAFGRSFALMPSEVVKTMMGWPEMVPGTVIADAQAAVKFNAEYSSAATKKYGKPHLHAVDACVICNGNVLLITRKNAAGQGTWALPGGFLDNDEWPVQGALRELREETGLDLSAEYVGQHQRSLVTYANPGRSRRGRTITHVLTHNLIVKPNQPMPTVTAGDDAASAFWWPLDRLNEAREKFFSDHFYIINEEAKWLLK